MNSLSDSERGEIARAAFEKAREEGGDLSYSWAAAARAVANATRQDLPAARNDYGSRSEARARADSAAYKSMTPLAEEVFNVYENARDEGAHRYTAWNAVAQFIESTRSGKE